MGSNFVKKAFMFIFLSSAPPLSILYIIYANNSFFSPYILAFGLLHDKTYQFFFYANLGEIVKLFYSACCSIYYQNIVFFAQLIKGFCNVQDKNIIINVLSQGKVLQVKSRIKNFERLVFLEIIFFKRVNKIYSSNIR